MVKKGLLCANIDGYRVQWKNDGTDYPAIWQDFKAGKLDHLPRLSSGRSYRDIARLDLDDGRALLLKHDWEKDPRFEKKLWCLLAGPWYSRLIRLTNRAVAEKGCRVAQDVFLVAERLKGPFSSDSWVIAEFVKGIVAPASPEFRRRVPELAGVMAELHDCGLASNDAHGGNFIITDEGDIRVIDLTLTSPVVICQANDVVKMKKTYKLDMPVKGFWRSLAVAILMAKHRRRSRRQTSAK